MKGIVYLLGLVLLALFMSFASAVGMLAGADIYRVSLREKITKRITALSTRAVR